jgi:uncharacterized protein YjeT (DUF2065 family)
MYCPECGEKIEFSAQSYCPYCGADIREYLEEARATDEEEVEPFQSQSGGGIQSTNNQQSEPVQEIEPMPHIEQISFQQQNASNRFARKCLMFALISDGLSSASLLYGVIFLVFFIIPIFYFPPQRIIIFMVITLILNGLGLMFAFKSKSYKKKSENTEPDNNLRKVGGVFSIIGTIFNAGLMVFNLIAGLILIIIIIV